MLLKYEVAVVGEDRLRRVMRSAQQELRAHARSTSAIVRQETTGRGASSRTTDPSRIEAARQRQRIAMQNRSFMMEQRLRDKAARDEERQAQRVTRQKVAMQNRAFAQEQRTREKAEKDETRRHAQAQRQKIAMQNRSFAQQRREQERIERNSGRATQRAVARRGRIADRVGTGVAGSFGGAIRNVVGMGGTALALAGGISAASALNDSVGLDARARQLIVNSRMPGAPDAFSADGLRERIRKTSLKNAVSEGDVAGGMEMFVQKTGDLKGAVNFSDVFGTVSKATGANFADVASTGADLMQKFDIKTVEDMAAAFAELSFQGKKGAFELKDMAEQFPEMAAAAQRAGLKGLSGMKTLGGLAQIARQSTGSGAEASTAVQMMLTKLIADSDKLKSGEALGGKKVNVFQGEDARSPLRNAPEVIADVIAASGGNLQQLQDVFDVRGIRAVSPMIDKFREASTAAGGGEAGTEAGRQAVLSMIADASDSGAKFTDLQRDAADAMKSTASQLEILNTKLKAAIASKMLPALEQLIPRLTELIPGISKAASAFATFADFLLRNPLTGIGAIIAASVAKDIAIAGVGKAASAGVAALVRTVPLGGGGSADLDIPGGGSTAKSKPRGTTLGSAVAAGGVGAAVGFTIATAILTAGVVNFEGHEANIDATAASLRAARESKDPEEIRAMRQEAEKRLDKSKQPGMAEAAVSAGLTGMLGLPAFLLKQLTGIGVDTDKAAKTVVGETVDPSRESAFRSQEAMISELRSLEAALERNTAATAANSALGGGDTSARSGIPVAAR